MERNWVPDSGQNSCFLPTGVRRIQTVENEIYLYDEAESLTYGCSETSMPPKSTGNIRVPGNAEFSANERGTKASNASQRKSRKSSTMVYESNEYQSASKIQSPRSAEGCNLSKDLISDFNSAIISKFKEFAITPYSSSLKQADSSKSIQEENVARQQSGSQGNSCKPQSDVEEIFVHKAQFFLSSSESDRGRHLSHDCQEEVFSTGISDMEEGAKKTADYKQETAISANFSKKNNEPREFEAEWYKTKSIVKSVEAKVERPAQISPNRAGPPVQGRLSLRSMKMNSKPPCFCLLDEIRKNNLVMKEDIFSSSMNKTSNWQPTVQPSPQQDKSKSDGRVDVQGKSRNTVMTSESPNRRKNVNCMAGRKANDEFNQKPTTNAIEVYEATGGEMTDDGANRRRNRHHTQTADITALAAEIREVRKRFEETYQPFHPPYSYNDSSNKFEEGMMKTSGAEMSVSPGVGAVPKRRIHNSYQQLDSSNPQINSSDKLTPPTDKLTNLPMTDINEAKTSTPMRRREKYVKLPGLTEAFNQQGSNFKNLRINDGRSFESFNALEAMSREHLANQMQQLKVEEQGLVQKKKIDTKDAATDIRIPQKNTVTQTKDKNMIDSCIQCESHIVDEINGRNVIKNDHQEIMICDDDGNGVQLYNELGHPLTDMDGYLLKDSFGRFLVRLDQFGVPISCTNGQAIFMEDSTSWDSVKNKMNIIHQSTKKRIQRRAGHKKSGKVRPSLRQLETAMQNLKSTLDWADKISLDDSHETSLGRLAEIREYSNSLGTIKTKQTAPNMQAKTNTSTLLAEMKSIARLRNALLEKVNFIVDNQKQLGKSRKTKLGEKRFTLSPSESSRKNWLSDPSGLGMGRLQERPNSPTFQAIKKFRETRADLGADLWVNTVSDQSLNEDIKALKLPGENGAKAGAVTWMGPFRGGSLNENLKAKQKVLVRNRIDDWMKSGSSKNLDEDFLVHLTSQRRDNESSEHQDVSVMELVSRDIIRQPEGLLDPKPAIAPLGTDNAKEAQPQLKGSQLLNSLEKEYNLKVSDSWIDPWKEETSLIDRLLQTAGQPSEWSNLRPSIEFDSDSSNHYQKR